ncbi:hypothetical protein [Halorubrum distributum]|uniref:hypothetical protein n=1 Tax=Halorubrum distributum TaxID=29283 RepID=UPI0012686EFD|nr:hypothetical protein [Halorubrum terrestre]
MTSVSSTIIASVGLITGGYLYPYLHEYVHWLVGELFSGDPNVLYDSWYRIPYPYAVEYNSLTQMPNWGVRIAGISPHLIWTTVALLFIGNPFPILSTDILLLILGISEAITSTQFLALVFITASAGAGFGVSPADLVATFRPNRFREYTGDGLSHLDWGRVLLGYD